MSRIKSIWVLLVVVIMGFTTTALAQVPEKPNPPRLVNDFAGIFTPQQVHVLEDTLVRFSKKTSNQVTIVTVKDLAGMEASQFAYEIGEQWGVGGSKLNNGVVILIKPKNETKGQAFIATGYGVEGVLPDASCSRIINNEMIPAFKKDDYFAGVVKALNVVLPVLAKEYSIEVFGDRLETLYSEVIKLHKNVKDAQTNAKAAVDDLSRQEFELRVKMEETKKQFEMYKAKMEALLISQSELIKEMNKEDE